MFATHRLSISKLQWQGYDEASKMWGEFKGLKTLILNKNKSAFYAHCLAHQPQLALIVAKNHLKMDVVFTVITNIWNIVGASAKCRDVLQEAQVAQILKGLETESGEFKIVRGLSQEMGLKCVGDTR